MPAADMRPADMRRLEPTVSAGAVSATTMPAATMSATAARVGFECEKRHEEEQHRGHASAGRQHRPQGDAGPGSPHPGGRLSLGISPRTKSLY
jgi:hypothetical protein